MQLTLQKFFSFFLLLCAAGSPITLYAEHCSSSNSTTGSCDQNNDCGCVSVKVDCFDVHTNGGNVYGRTYFNGRNQGMNTPRKMMGVEDKIHLFDTSGFYGVASASIEYQSLMKNRNNSGQHDIGQWFSLNGNAAMTYGLNNTTPGTPDLYDINGLNFGLTSSGSFFFCPNKSDIIVDLDLFLGLDNLFCGLWTRIGLPIVNSRWDLNIQETSFAGAPLYPTDSVGADNPEVPFQTMTAALKGAAFADAPPLLKGRVDGKRTTTALANARIDVGYDWFRRERWHIATSWIFILPVGTRPCADYLFNAVVGNGRMFELGTGLNAAYELWNNCDATKSLTFYFDGSLDASFRNKQNRLTTLRINGQSSPWSQYLLLKTFNNAQQATGLERAANILAGDMEIEIPIIADGAAMIQYMHNKVFVGVGYDFWGRTKERVKALCFGIQENTYGIKGGTQWNGVVSGVAGAGNNVTASNSTIGLNAAADAAPVFLDNDDIDLIDAPFLHPGTYSNGVFGFIGYNFTTCNWQPYVLIGGQAEFGRQNKAFSQWGIIGKGGIQF